MKKIIMCLVAILLLLTLVACGETDCQHLDTDRDSLCDKCGETYDDGTGDALAHVHDWSTWIVTTPSTCQTKGEETRSCSCGQSEKRDAEIDTTVHSYNKEVIAPQYLKSPADCNNAAVYYYSCVCGEKGIATFTDGEAIGHSYNKEVIAPQYLKSPPDCNNAAVYYYSCVCGEKGIATFTDGEAIGHSYIIENVDIKYQKYPATVESPATFYKSCTCGEASPTETFNYGSPLLYTVRFDLNGGSSDVELSELKVTEVNANDFNFDITKEGWSFRGWSLNGVKIFDENGMKLENITYAPIMEFKAEFNQKMLLNIEKKLLHNGDMSDITFNIGTLTGAGEYNYNTYVDLYVQPIEGYTFVGWFYDGYALSHQNDYRHVVWSDDVTLQAVYRYTYYDLEVLANIPEHGKVVIKSNGSSNNVEDKCSAYYTQNVTVAAYTENEKRFLGWYDEEGKLVSPNAVFSFVMPNRDYRLIAKWEEAYTITYDVNGGDPLESNTQNVIYNSDYILAETYRRGYTFLGWYNGEDRVYSGIWRIDSDVTLVAKWQANKYTVIYDETKEIYGDVTVMFDYNYVDKDPLEIVLNNGDPLPVPPTPQREGYIFAGWYTNSWCTKKFNFSEKITNDITLYAKWVEYIELESRNNWIFEDNVLKSNNHDHNSVSRYQIVAETDMIISFRYKTSSESEYDILSIIKNNETLKSCSGETFYASYTVSLKKGDVLTFVYEKDYKDDCGNDSAYICDFTITSDVTYVSTSVADITHVIGYVYEKRETSSIDITFGDTIDLPELTQTGYTFLGWYNGDEKVESGAWNYDQSLVLFPKWSANTYDVVYELGGNMGSETTTMTFGTYYTLPTPDRVGYTFIGWYIGEEEIKSGYWSIAADVSLEAKWQANTYTVTYDDTRADVKVTFNYNYSGYETTTVTLSSGQVLNRPTDPTRSGYVFTGWYTNSSCTTRYEFTGTITGDMTLYAGWTDMSMTSMYTETQIDPTDYTSSSDYCSVSTSYTSSSSKKHIYLVAEETGTHYVYFKNNYSSTSYGYYLQIYNLTTGTTIRSSSTVTSTSFSSKSFTCSAGDVIVISLYRYNTSYSSYAYFYFDGFDSPAASTAKASLPTGEFEYKNNSTYIDSVVYDENYSLIVPVRTGYTFLGWYIGEDKIESGTWSIASDVTLTPMWQANSYTITLDANGGTVSSTSVLVTYDQAYTLPTPTRTGYTFAGWYNGTEQYEDGIWKDVNDVTLVASWTANTYTVTYDDTRADVKVTFNYNYSGATSSTVTLTNGQTLSYPAVPTRSGYAFAGWYTDSSCTTPYNFSGDITEDITLYAKWFAMTSSYASREYVDIANYNSSSSKKSVSITASSSSSKNYYYFTCYESGTYTLYAAYTSGDFYITAYNATQGTTVLSNTNFWGSGTTSKSAQFTANAGDVIYVSLYKYSSSGSTGSGTFYVSGASHPTSTAKANNVSYFEGETVTVTVTFGSSYTLPTLTRAGYTFLGWYNGDEKVESDEWNIDSDVTLTPRWE